MYWTTETTEQLIRFNASTNETLKEQIYSKYLHAALSIIADNTLYQFGQTENDDLRQDIIIKLYSSLSKIKTPQAALKYLIKVAESEYHKYRKSNPLRRLGALEPLSSNYAEDDFNEVIEAENAHINQVLAAKTSLRRYGENWREGSISRKVFDLALEHLEENGNNPAGFFRRIERAGLKRNDVYKPFSIAKISVIPFSKEQ